MKKDFGYQRAACTTLVATALIAAYLIGSLAVGHLSMTIVLAGIVCVYFYSTARRNSARLRPLFRAVLAVAGLVLILTGALDRIESIYICRTCPVVRVTSAYRFFGAVFYEGCYDTLPGGSAGAKCAHKFFLAARFRYLGLLWRGFTDDSPPPGTKKLVRQRGTEKGLSLILTLPGDPARS